MREVNHTTESVTDLLVFNSYFCNLTPFEIGYSLYATLLKCSVVPEVLEVQVVPSEEVRMVPDLPTATKILFPYAMEYKFDET